MKNDDTRMEILGCDLHPFAAKTTGLGQGHEGDIAGAAVVLKPCKQGDNLIE